METAFILFSILCMMIIGLYSTWLFYKRLRKGAPKMRSFRQWLKDLLEAVW